MITIRIAQIDSPIPAIEYDGTEGYVIEVDGEWVAQAPTYAGALAAARQLTAGGKFTRDACADYWGRECWTAVVAALPEEG